MQSCHAIEAYSAKAAADLALLLDEKNETKKTGTRAHQKKKTACAGGSGEEVRKEAGAGLAAEDSAELAGDLAELAGESTEKKKGVRGDASAAAAFALQSKAAASKAASKAARKAASKAASKTAAAQL